jgi:uncharacterized protein (DUF1684 family)
MEYSVYLRRAVTISTLLVGAGLPAVIGCSGERDLPEPVVMDEAEHERWEIALVEHRIEKNEEFRVADTTPLPPAELPDFVGLNYYYPERTLRFRVPLQNASGTDTVRLAKRGGRQVAYLHRGDVTIGHDGKAYTLAVFGPADPSEGDYLWLPFFDATNEDETYPGGRYLDLQLAADGRVEVDFNLAYNPLCAYNAERYDCTLPPPGNRLPFAVRAGEQRWHNDRHD